MLTVNNRRVKNADAKKEQLKRFRIKNKDKFNASVKRAKDAKPEKYKAIKRKYYESNREELYKKSRQWMKEHPEYVRACAKARNARVKQATPIWARTGQVMAKIRDIYLKCPDGFHVDHIIPLKHPSVSGLHVPSNLQYLPASENIRKKNSF